MNLTKEQVGLVDCQITNIVMEVGDVPPEATEIENTLSVDVTILSDSETDRPIGVDVLAYIKMDEGSVFSMDIAARVIFDIPEDFSDDEAIEYLQDFGSTRAFDAIRPHIIYLTATAGFPTMELPPIVVG